MHSFAKHLCALGLLGLSAATLADEIEQKFVTAGLVDIQSIAPGIQVDLVNANPDKNFFQTDFYQGLNKAYLRKPIAQKLAKAQAILKQKHPSYALLVLDAARPRSVSRAMYEKMKGTRFERYVARPDKGSMHNYGIAIDITIMDGQGHRLDMGPSPFYSSHASLYWQYLLKKAGKELSPQQKRNRALLKRVMQKAGFYPLAHEWWHFNGMKKTDVRKSYPIIE